MKSSKNNDSQARRLQHTSHIISLHECGTKLQILEGKVLGHLRAAGIRRVPLWS